MARKGLILSSKVFLVWNIDKKISNPFLIFYLFVRLYWPEKNTKTVNKDYRLILHFVLLIDITEIFDLNTVNTLRINNLLTDTGIMEHTITV